MFKKNQCPKCGKKVSEKYSFCPDCGTRINSNNEDWGMLGKNDFLEDNNNNFNNPLFGGFGGSIINKMFNNAMKMLEKEMQKNTDFQIKNPNTHFELFINGKRISPDKIKVTRKPMQKNSNENLKKIILPTFDSKSQKEFTKLSKKEPKTNLRRLSDKVIYEIEIPGIKSIQEVSIVQLENSIEIKAVSKDKAYTKIIPINLPITKYDLEKGKLILELEAKD